MDYKGFIKKLEENKLGPVYLFTGFEEYLIIDIVERLRKKYIDDSLEALNYVNISGNNRGFDSVLNACETLPFMAEKKLVLVRDIVELLESDEGDVDGKLSSYVEELDDYVILILIDKSNRIRKSTKIYKELKKNDRIVEFNKLRGRDLNLWIEYKLRENKKNISNANISYFIQKSTYSEYGSLKTLYDLENEILKLANYASEDLVSREDIDQVLTKTLDTNIFNLLGSINRKDSDSALKIFNEMYISNEPIGRIFFMIIRQLRLMLGYKLYREKGYTEKEIGDKLQIKSYECSKIGSQSRSYTIDQLENSLEYVLGMDIKQKTSSYDEKLGLEILIINLVHSI